MYKATILGDFWNKWSLDKDYCNQDISFYFFGLGDLLKCFSQLYFLQTNYLPASGIWTWKENKSFWSIIISQLKCPSRQRWWLEWGINNIVGDSWNRYKGVYLLFHQCFVWVWSTRGSNGKQRWLRFCDLPLSDVFKCRCELTRDRSEISVFVSVFYWSALRCARPVPSVWFSNSITKYLRPLTLVG